MSIDERLRTGLVSNTDHLVPAVEQELAATWDRARVRRMRRGVLAVAAAAVVATLAIRHGEVPELRDAEPIAPDPAPSAGPVDLVGVRSALKPGTYSLALFGETKDQPLPRAVFEVPEGFYSNGGWIIDAGGGSEPEQMGVVQVWRVGRVLGTPCRHGTAQTVGPTAAHLARALVRQRGPATQPIPAELDGRPGLYLQVTVPPDADLVEACPGKNYSLWLTGDNDGPWHSDRPGIVHHLWIIDVDGTPLVVAVSNYPNQPATLQRELIDIAESVSFESPGS